MSVHDQSKKHRECMEGVTQLLVDNAIELKGKQYLQVVHRVNLFRQNYGLAYSIDTEILVDDGTRVLMVAYIKDNDGRVVGKGHAEEIRNAGPVNRTSAIENCETSAIGRALANIGLAGNEYASAFEMGNIENKEEAVASQEKAKVSQEKLEDSKKKVKAIQSEVDKQPEKKEEPHPEDVKLVETTAEILVKSLEGSSLDSLRKTWASNKVVLESWKDQYQEIYERVEKAFKDKAEELKKEGKENNSE
tara:strand:- start:75 stop:818 length:744 start_codon:yes stop_codon:yes gene_type:complete